MTRGKGILQRGFDDILLGGVIALIVTAVLIMAGFYIAPPAHLEIPEIQPAIRVTSESEFPVGSSRVRDWGAETILIVRPDSLHYFALQGVSPADGCLLRWDPDAFRVYSPCSYIVYDLRGDVIAGLSNRALRRYAVTVRDGVVFVSRSQT
jgi:nitrite reductase/ring-hydroxylating ferredoxin subunit